MTANWFHDIKDDTEESLCQLNIYSELVVGCSNGLEKNIFLLIY